MADRFASGMDAVYRSGDFFHALRSAVITIRSDASVACA